MTLEAYVLADKARGVPRGDISSQQGWMRKFWVIGLEVDFLSSEARGGLFCQRGWMRMFLPGRQDVLSSQRGRR